MMGDRVGLGQGRCPGKDEEDNGLRVIRAVETECQKDLGHL